MKSLVCALYLIALSVDFIQGGLVGTLPTEQHRVSGQFYIVDSKTIFIEDFNYDGGGPGAYLYYYRPGVAVNRNGGGIIIPLPSSVGQVGGTYPGAFQTRSFNNEDIMVTLPDGVDACDIGAITVWCQPFRAIFTRLAIPRSTFVNNGNDPCTVVNPGGPNTPGPEFNNCEVLHETLQLSWRVDNSNSQVRFRLCGCTATDASTIQYLGFGLSGSNSATSMFRADATIAWVDENGIGQAQDYYLSNYVQCRGGSGACPDTVDTTTGRACTNDVSDVSGFVQDGQQCISFTRPFNPTDSGSCDRPIDPTNQNQYIVWGIGSLGETAFQHHTRASSTDSPLHLGRAPSDNCANVQLSCQQCDAFPANRITALEDATFVAVIGPSANPRGYTGITGQPGWGIAWYINNTIIPELVVERGRTYTFLVHGGNVSSDDANYHPFYITDSMNGGRLLNTPQQRMTETVYAGFNNQDNVTAVGPLCEYNENSAAERVRQTCGSYSDYFSSLNFACQSREPGRLVWRPDNNTPDLVYYQCATHLNLGWRIRVMDPDPVPTTVPDSEPPTTQAVSEEEIITDSATTSSSTVNEIIDFTESDTLPTTSDDDPLSTDTAPTTSTNLDDTDDVDNMLPTTAMNSPSDIESSTDHVISTQPISTDHEDTMSTTTDMIQTDSTDIEETTELDLLMITAIEATTESIFTDHEETTTNMMDMTQTESNDIRETTELDSLMTTSVEATTPLISTDQEDATNGDMMQTDSTDTQETTEDDLLQTTMEEVQTTEADVTQLEGSVTEDVDGGLSFTADHDGESEKFGVDPDEVFATAGAMVISPIAGLVIALAVAIANLNP